ncbi:MAG: immunoglobulin domain-containing protein [Lachnospiraceae bacterium]|nr:immunoglobulin domain-containing protein [Lachnospiraceae bacterium]
MKQKKWFTKVLAFLLAVSLAWVPMGDMGSAYAAEGDVVTFTDSEMERYFLEKLGKGSGDSITEGELAAIDKFSNDGSYEITDYSALRYCSGLTSINIVRAFDAEAMDLSFLGSPGNFNNLKSLTLRLVTNSGNQREVTNFDAIENCTALTYLKINYISTTEWDCISNLTNLTNLDIENTNCTILPDCSNMTNLKEVILCFGEELTDISGLENCNNLTTVDLSQCTVLEDITPLAGKTGITELDMPGVSITEDNESSYMSTMASLTGLEELNVSDINLKDEQTSMFNNLTNLKRLQLGGNKLTNANFLATNKDNLEFLSLDNNPLTDASALGQLTNLESLYLANTEVTDFSFISQMTSLTKSFYWDDERTQSTVYRTSADGSAVVIDNPVKNEKGEAVAPDSSSLYSYNAQTNQITIPLSSIQQYTGHVSGGVNYTISMTAVGGDTLTIGHRMIPYVLGITTQPQDVEINEGQSALLQLGMVGSSIKSIQWYKDGELYASNTYNLQVTESGDYYAVITDTFSTLDTPLQVTSETATVTVNVPLAITTQPQGITLLEGESGSLSVEAKGMAPLKYQWYKDNVAISGATSATLALNDVTTAATGNYTVKVTDAKSGEITSTAATVTVNEKVKILTQPQGFTALEGVAKSLSVTVDGTAPITYQWYKDNVAINGATSATLELADITMADAGSYTVKITDKYSSMTSAVAKVIVHKNLKITGQPQAIALVEGETGSLSVTAEGQGTVKYQWYKDNVAISGATSATLNLGAVELADAGAYKVVVSDDNSAQNGTKSSSVVTVTVDKKLVITTQPRSITLVEGANGSLSVTAAGQGTLTYQWYKDGVKLDGKTSATLSLSAITAEQAGKYTVVVSDANSATKGSLTSSEAVVTVEKALEITGQPVSVTVIEGDEAVLTVEAVGTGTLKYQWYKGNIKLNGETSATLTLSAAALTDAGEYKVVVSDDNSATNGTLTSQAATIAVQKKLVITTQPQSITLVDGDNGSLTVTAAGQGTLTYQWYKDDVKLDGRTSATLSLPAITAEQAGKYTVVVSDANSATKGSLTSSEAVVTVEKALEITGQPVSVTVIEGDEAVLTVEAVGTGTLKYQWYKGNTKLNGATSANLTLSDVELTDAGEYKVVVSDDNSSTHGSLTGNVATITVQKSLKITTQPQGVSLWENEDGSLTVNAEGHGTLTYQWYKGDTVLDGETTATLTLNDVALTDAGDYKVIVSDANSGIRGKLTSQVATVVVHESLKIKVQPQPITIVEGKDGSLSVTVVGTEPITYQWYKDGVALEGETSTTLSLSAITMADAGKYQVKVSDKRDDTIYSNEVAVVVEEALEITREPENLSLIEGENGELAVEAVGAGTLTYQWYKDGVAVEGAGGTTRAMIGGNQATFTISDAQLSDAGEYKVVISDGNSDENGTLTSRAVTVIVDKKLVISKNPENVTLVEGKSTILSVEAEGEGTLTYQWYKDGSAINGEVGASLMLMEVTFADAGKYTVTVTDKNGSLTGSEATIIVEEDLEIIKQPEGVTLIEGEDGAITVEAVGAGELIYTWYKDGVLVEGANKATYVLNDAERGDAGTYKVVITDKNGNLTSEEVSVNVEKALEIVKQPEGLTLEEGDNGSITVIASGEGTLSYQWYKDGVIMKGANAATLSLTKLELADEGTYQVEITDKNTTLISEAVTVVVEEEEEEDDEAEEESAIIVSPKTGENNQMTLLLSIAVLLAGMSMIFMKKRCKEAEK